MAESRDLRDQIEKLVERAQDDLLDASRQLADGITKETGRFVPPISKDIERVVDEAFDFAERVLKGQRKMINDLVKTVNEESRRAAEAGTPGHRPGGQEGPGPQDGGQAGRRAQAGDGRQGGRHAGTGQADRRQAVLSAQGWVGTAPTTSVTDTPSPGSEPTKGASPKAKIPPSEPISQ